ncbi:MAG: sigma-70 family RNA polymerase sigma factor [Parabacteroides sp.]|uniref:RNA polymerase sigma-70 factor, ECF subfamily n=1 Tax=Parabacteroides chartae TaxID=1037355 RepID=A0A1T5A684_9BACT|nr:sigma-70 family RNA polymerase sigma factor [Parabacteroides chartae]MDD3508315.1 sigma-70 family RNA polymerase sigma factor [Parabacteroides sp.]SKB30436.1 RNA polymerase sigma-70 factor, ECF subfamily [Parabacteroides chartae]
MLDKADFKFIFDNHFEEVRRYIFYRCGDEETASDLAQEVFMRVWEKRTKLTLDYIKPLLYKIAGDCVVSDYRKKTVQIGFAQNMKLESENISPQDQLQYEELKQQYAKALEQLSESQRTTFLMSRNDELKYNEIAERLNISVKAVEKRITETLRVLRSKLL